MTVAIWTLLVVSFAACWLIDKLNRDLRRMRNERDAAIKDAIQAREERGKVGQELFALKAKILAKSLTSAAGKAQDSSKRFSGPQLRRMAEQVNNAAWDGLQERPNSEILQEQANG